MAFRALTDRRSPETDYTHQAPVPLIRFARQETRTCPERGGSEGKERARAALSSHDRGRPRVRRGCHGAKGLDLGSKGASPEDTRMKTPACSPGFHAGVIV